MALPPEPIEELLEQATAIIEGEVLAVVSTGPVPPRREAREGATSVGNKASSQVVTLKVRRSLKGKLAGELTVEKPEAGYALRAGNHGAFFLQDGEPHARIIGRYGPDTYTLASVEHVLKGKK